MGSSKRRHRPIVAVACALVLGAGSAAVRAEEEGLVLVQRYCARCHEIAPGVEPPAPSKPEATSFVLIAKDPAKFTVARIDSLLAEPPHSTMQPITFTAEQRLSMIEYIRALATK